jgi:hypothetical protein
MKDLGYMNNWKHVWVNNRIVYDKDECSEYLKCRELGHSPAEISHSYRGSDTEYICPICGICWHVDSSD